MNEVLSEFLMCVSDDMRPFYADLASQAQSLGYKPKKAKTAALNIVFTSNATKKTIMKFSIEDGRPLLKLKFYASREYSPFFHEAIRHTIEEYDYRYTGCYGCGRCMNGPEGYYYRYTDGRMYFRCGGELIALPGITTDIYDEIKRLLSVQHSFFSQRNSS